MIYLIETTYYDKETKEVLDLLKIGYTEDSKKDKRFMLTECIIRGINYYMKFLDTLKI